MDDEFSGIDFSLPGISRQGCSCAPPHDHLTTDRQSLQLVMENVNRVTAEGGQVFNGALMKEAAKQGPVTRA